MAKQPNLRKQNIPGKRKTNTRQKEDKSPLQKKIKLDPELFKVITKEAAFLGLSQDEYCKLVFTSAQVLRETTLNQPLKSSTLIKSVIDSPLLLSLVKTFATNFLSSSLQDLFTNLQNQNPNEQPATLRPSYPNTMNHLPPSPYQALPNPPSPYPPTPYWSNF